MVPGRRRVRKVLDGGGFRLSLEKASGRWPFDWVDKGLFMQKKENALKIRQMVGSFWKYT